MRWLAVIAVLLGTAVFGFALGTPVAAQTAPATFYGRGAPLQAGDRVAVLINGVTCATTTVNASLEWAVQVPASAGCGPSQGAAVTITVNGVAATVTPAPVWQVGGTPPDVANGYAISLPAATATPAPTQAPGAAVTPLLSGSIPQAGGYGIIAVNSTAAIGSVVAATGCPTASMALYATVAGEFIAYVPGTSIQAVNAAFLAVFTGGNIPAGTALMGKCV